MDDFDLRDLLSPPLQYRSDLPSARPPMSPHQCAPLPEGHPALPEEPCGGVLAMAYVPNQRWEGLYEPEQALRRGTLFKGLDLPFEGGMRE
jgi:hypothetical protein